jgi:hypothetical protein
MIFGVLFTASDHAQGAMSRASSEVADSVLLVAASVYILLEGTRGGFPLPLYNS